MAGIQEYLDLIKNAVYGREVRQAIHDGIETCYKEGKAGATDLVARSEISAVNAELTARIDEIVAPSGEAPSAAEVTDARIGADNSTYDSLGNALRGQVRGLQNSLFHRQFNVLDFVKKQNKNHQGITYTWNEDGTCTVRGTATATSFCTIFSNANAFPPFLHAGQPVSIRVESDSNTPVAGMDIYKYIGGVQSGTWYSGITADYQGDGALNGIIPEELSGMLVRIKVPSGQTVNETVRISIVPQESMNSIAIANAFVSDADDLKRNGIYFVSSTGGTATIANVPNDVACWLDVKCVGDKTSLGVLQIAYPWSEVYDPYYRTCRMGVWNEWKKMGSDDGGGTVIQNTYNITTNPHITTDANGWLQPVDTESSSETGKTDMTGAIMSMLTDTGYCHLAKGIYYVSGNIDMPYGSTLEGCGEGTIIRLLSSVESGYIVKPTKYSTIRGIRFSGGYSDGDVSTSDIGTRNGVAFLGNKDGQESSLPLVDPCMISDCWFENFSGSGIYCHNTGGSLKEALIVSSCYMRRCKVGINIDYYSEYHKFTNIITYQCYYGCINNGGNNVFTGCTFHATVGFTLGNLRNNAHGSCIGCTFNHIDSWNRPSTHGGGIGVKANGTGSGFVFTGCQLWYGAVEVKNSRGIAFSDCLFGGNSPEITVTGGYPVFFQNCIFHAAPTLDVNDSTRFDNCYLDEDGSVISA